MFPPIGKTVAQKTYWHTEHLPVDDADLLTRIAEAEHLTKVRRLKHFNLIRVDHGEPEIALLHYPDFADEPFPSLRESWLVNLADGTVSYRTYADSLNPPILHRKELLLPPDHPRREEYAALTAAAEAIGLFDQPTRIGYRRQWLEWVREKGYRIDGHALVPLGNDESPDLDTEPESRPLHGNWQSSRQLTALVRYGFSAPVQTLARYGFLDGRYRVFDYGCGRGSDVRGLVENGLTAAGWDPFYAPDQAIATADIVNLGFVINVIEDFDERVEALTRAYGLAECLLVVSVMLANQNAVRGERFRDGVLTQRGTFQKYFTQAEIKAFVEAALDEEALPVAPGVLYVFRDKDAEQRFLRDRYRSRRNRLRDPVVSRRERPSPRQRAPKPDRYSLYQDPLERLWELWLSLGRKPDKAEVADLEVLTEGFGSLAAALRAVEARHDAADLDRARAARMADLEVYFALNLFEQRKAYKHLEVGLQQDIRQLFGDYPAVQAAARELLFRIADVDAISSACREAAERGLGWLESGRSLQLHVSLVEQLPPLLRIYVGCAAVLYGDYRNADLVKIHIGSGKLSLLRYDNFEGQPLPRMLERVKIKLREQDIDYFAYGDEYPPPLLYRKSRYINEEFPHYPEQVEFDAALDGLGLFDLSGYGPRPEVFDTTLKDHHWVMAGFQLRRAPRTPDLDSLCGGYLTYRQFIQCGETQARTGYANLPQNPASYTALLDLTVHVLDPVIDYFGMIRLTYGFCSLELAKAIPGRIDPKRDQHAAHEHHRNGRPICERRGAAVDFLIDDENMLEVVQWVVTNTPFDRLYFYGKDLPIHVSHGPNHDRQIVLMLPNADGRRVPRVMGVEAFLALAHRD